MASKNHVYSLRNLGLPAMKSLEDFAHETHLSEKKVRYLSTRANHLYKTYKIAKKTGKFRVISQPSRELKAVQSWILRNILDKLSSSMHSKGFEIGSSILDNALPHVGSNYILSLDLENFFPNVMASKVYGVFDSIGYNKEMTVLLTNLCVFGGGLPQGAPSSPKLANLVCSKLDARIHGYAGPKGIVYTRYADDITLSALTAKKIHKAKQFLGTILADEDFKINNSKTKLSGTRRQKKVTGLVLSENSLGIGRARLRDIRAKIHHLFINKSTNFPHVNGLIAFTYGVDKKAHKKICTYIGQLEVKYPKSDAASKLYLKVS